MLLKILCLYLHICMYTYIYVTRGNLCMNSMILPSYSNLFLPACCFHCIDSIQWFVWSFIWSLSIIHVHLHVMEINFNTMVARGDNYMFIFNDEGGYSLWDCVSSSFYITKVVTYTMRNLTLLYLVPNSAIIVLDMCAKISIRPVI